MVVQACLSGVVKQSGSGPPSRQIFDSISIRTVSPKPRGLVAWREKYLDGHRTSRVQINDFSVSCCAQQGAPSLTLANDSRLLSKPLQMEVDLLVIENHGVVLCLQAVILALLSSKLVLEVVCCQPELQYIHGLLLLNVLRRKGQL